MNKAQEAAETFRSGFNCCQAVLSTYADRFGLDRRKALSLGTGFAGGMAFTGQACGAVCGAVMLIGLAHGRTELADDAPRKAALDLVQEFVRRFRQRHGTINCNELVGFDLGDPRQMEAARAKGVFKTLCPAFVEDAARIVEDLLFTVQETSDERPV